MTDYRNIEEKISAYLDNQMSEADRAAFEVEMDGNPELVARIERWSATEQLFASSIPTPSDAHLDALLSASTAANTNRWPGLRIAAMLVVFAFGGVGGYGLSQFTTNPQTTIIVQATMGATNSHRVFAAEKRHAVEVTADETEHLQTWLADRMGREMTVPNLSAFGLTFLGGRMLPFDDRAAAQYMYETADGKRVTLFMTRLDQDENTDVQVLEDQGLTSLRWQSGEWVFILTAPLEQQQLAPMQVEVRDTLL
ncbi:anti-sigma factor family protein [Cognatishimia activa]|uniref:Anti-sigma factor n=1 Tax=Cognatishimia activa TaxID=1715691 RepID=A0A975EME3_9RHOB|nr:anti-sigma factor [Cognatishimia activa]QTN34725.1 anti-sigma factor [Cognatishimia activa]